MRAIPVLLAAILAGPAAADEALSADAPAAIRQVIAGQLDAFRHDDGPAAFRFASPGIQARFGDGPHFLQMVRTAYPVVISPSSVAFGELATQDGHIIQTVDLVGQTGTAATALYDMEQEPDGSWKIAGCTLLQRQHLDI